MRQDTPRPVDWPGRGTFVWQPGPAAGYGPVGVEWLGSTVDFVPDPNTEGVKSALATADALLADPQGWQARLREVAIRDAYPLWREGYRGDGDPDLPPDEWWSHVSILSVAFDTGGRFEFVLYGGDGPLHGMKFVARGDIGTGFDHATD